MPQFIDRRLNPRDKSLGNRQRFLRRTRAADQAGGRQGGRASAASPTPPRAERFRSRPTASASRSSICRGAGGDRERVFPGNKEFVSGDQIEQPERRRRRASGRKGPDSGGGEDAFSFALTEDEFLDILFEDLELPDLVKASLKDATARRIPPRRLFQRRRDAQSQRAAHHAQSA